jgi:hypothetical protein
MSAEDKEYSVFTQKYIQIKEELNGTFADYRELQENFKEIPEDLLKKIAQLSDVMLDMNKIGEVRWNKMPRQLTNDGWKFWIKEDNELREERYGTTNNRKI